MRKLILLIVIMTVIASCGRERTASPEAPAASRSQPAAESAPPPSAPAVVGIGSSMPPYTARLLDGGEFDVASERGKVVLLNLWATWCGPCRYEIPALEKLHQKYEPKGFKVVGVSIDEGDAAPVKEFVTEHKMHYPVVLDPDGKLANMFQTTVIPTTVLIDRNGKVVWKKYGAIEENDRTLTKAIETAL